MIEKKISRFMGIAMGLTMSCTMSLVGTFLGSVFFPVILPKLLGNPVNRSIPSIIFAFLPSLLVSLVVTSIISVGLGFIVPMKKINDAVEQKRGKKDFVTHLIQSLISDCIYTLLISTTMAFVSTFLFGLAGQRTAYEQQIAGLQGAVEEMNAGLNALQNKPGALTDEEMGKIVDLSNRIDEKNADIDKIKEKKDNLKLVPEALKSLARSLPVEFIIALIVIIIIEPIFQKIAFKKYIPNYGSKVDGDDDI